MPNKQVLDANAFGAHSGKRIEYTLYIEGVRVPFSSLAMQVVENTGAIMSFDLIPLPQALKFVRGMLVHLFKRVDTDAPRLRFFGILRNVIYEKTEGSRALRVEAGSLDSRWEHFAFAEFDAHALNSIRNPVLNQHGQNIVDTSGNNPVADAVRSRQAVINAVGGGNNIQIRDDPMGGIGSSSGQAPDSRAALSQEVANAHMRAAATIDPIERARILSEPVQRLVMRNVSRVTAQIIENIQGSGGDILAGLIKTIKNCYTDTNEYNILEYHRVKMDNAVIGVSMMQEGFASSLFSAPVDASIGLEEQFTRYGLIEVLGRVVDNSGGSTRLKDIITSLLGAIFCQMSVDPTQMERSIKFHPIMSGCIPPRCNVLFPNQIKAISFNPNLWGTPTRSVVSFSNILKMGRPDISVGQTNSPQPYIGMYLCDSMDPELSVSKILNVQDANELRRLARLVTKEEGAKGVLCNYPRVSSPILGRLNDTASQMLADFIHNLGKYGARSCTVMGDMFDDMVVGMPVLIIDNYFSIYGVLSGLSYNVDPEGGMVSSAYIAYPIFVITDFIPDPLLWLKVSEMYPDKIGAVYKALFGCDSIYDPSVPYDPKKPQASLVGLTNKLLDDFYAAPDKRLFVDKYRARPFLTEAEVFEKYHKAKPVASTGATEVTTMWTGEDFGKYKIPANYDYIDRQKLVVDFVTEYYGRSGRYEK